MKNFLTTSIILTSLASSCAFASTGYNTNSSTAGGYRGSNTQAKTSNCDSSKKNNPNYNNQNLTDIQNSAEYQKMLKDNAAQIQQLQQWLKNNPQKLEQMFPES